MKHQSLKAQWYFAVTLKMFLVHGKSRVRWIGFPDCIQGFKDPTSKLRVMQGLKKTKFLRGFEALCINCL